MKSGNSSQNGALECEPTKWSVYPNTPEDINIYILKLKYVKNTEIPMAESLTAGQNFVFLVKIPIAESLTPVQIFCFLVIYALLGWVGFLSPCCHVLFYGSMIMILSHVAWCVVE